MAVRRSSQQQQACADKTNGATRRSARRARGDEGGVGAASCVALRRSTTLASSQRRRNSSRCEHHDLPPCLEPLSRLPFHGNHSPPENVHRNNFSKRTIHSSILIAPLSPPPKQCL